MDIAKTRKSGAIEFISRHLVSAAFQALSATRQTVVAKLLNVADSTVLRRTEKYPELMETLAASGVRDLVMDGEIKLPIGIYRHLIWMQMEYSKLQLELTNEKASNAGTLEA